MIIKKLHKHKLLATCRWLHEHKKAIWWKSCNIKKLHEHRKDYMNITFWKHKFLIWTLLHTIKHNSHSERQGISQKKNSAKVQVTLKSRCNLVDPRGKHFKIYIKNPISNCKFFNDRQSRSISIVNIWSASLLFLPADPDQLIAIKMTTMMIILMMNWFMVALTSGISTRFIFSQNYCQWLCSLQTLIAECIAREACEIFI